MLAAAHRRGMQSDAMAWRRRRVLDHCFDAWSEAVTIRKAASAVTGYVQSWHMRRFLLRAMAALQLAVIQVTARARAGDFTLFLISVTTACAKRTSAAASVECRRREPARAISPE